METIKDFCDKVSADLRRTSPIRFISRRHIYNTVTPIIENMIQRALSERRLYRDSSLHTSINCIELERIEENECDVEIYRGCDILMKSLKKLPSIISGGRGNAIIGLYTLDGILISSINYNLFGVSKGREAFGELEPYYFIKNGYLYIANQNIELVNLILVTLDTKNAELMNCNTECDECTPDFDYKMIMPDKYKIDIMNLLKSSLLQDYMQIHPTRLENIEKNAQ